MNRELDLKVAKEIFEWNTYEPIGPDADGENACQVLVPHEGYLKELFSQGYTLPRKGKIGEGFFTPQYCSDFSSAMEVVRKVRLPIPAYNLPANASNLVSLAYAYFKAKRKTSEMTKEEIAYCQDCLPGTWSYDHRDNSIFSRASRPGVILEMKYIKLLTDYLTSINVDPYGE